MDSSFNVKREHIESERQEERDAITAQYVMWCVCERESENE